MELEVIYKIVSPNGKVYIGRTKNFNDRMADHRHIAKVNKSNYALYKAINKYGWDNMIKEIICEIDASQSQTVEEEFIKMYDSVNKGYNNTYAGHGGNMFKNNPELLEKLKKTLSEKFTGENNGMFGKIHSIETKEKQKQKAKGRFTLEWFIDRNGKEEGELLYKKRCESLKNRNLKKDNNGRFVKSSK